jgi:hypothetical protein
MSMRMTRAAAVAALAASTSISAQILPPPSVDLTTVQAVVGNWNYRPIAGGSEADFTDSGGHVRLTVRCSLATRAVSIVRASVRAAGPVLTVTTSEGTRNLPSSYVAGSLIAPVASNDRLLDEIAFSRGKWAMASTGDGALVVPGWAEPARVIEDCRG